MVWGIYSRLPNEVNIKGHSGSTGATGAFVSWRDMDFVRMWCNIIHLIQSKLGLDTINLIRILAGAMSSLGPNSGKQSNSFAYPLASGVDQKSVTPDSFVLQFPTTLWAPLNHLSLMLGDYLT